MRLLDMIIKEYISIVELLEIQKEVENDRIIIEREDFRGLLERYAYATFSTKTRVYKALNFIIHDKNNYTMPHKDKERGKTVRKVIINYKTYKTLKHLYSTILSS